MSQPHFSTEKKLMTLHEKMASRDLHNLGLKGRLPTFISKFLSDRSFNVRFGNTLSGRTTGKHFNPPFYSLLR